MNESSRPNAPRILNVGQCGFDHASISGYFTDRFNARVDAADDLEDVRAALREARYSLVLVNRVLDHDGSSGLELIRALREDPETKAVPAMLVSDYAEAQEAACKLGAVPGFGKSALYDEETSPNQACSRGMTAAVAAACPGSAGVSAAGAT